MILDAILNESSINTGSEPEYLVEATTNGYDPSLLGAMQIVSEAMTDEHSLNTAMNAVDYKSLMLIGESAHEEAQTLQESVLTDYFAKAKGLIMKLWGKVKEFYSNVKLYFSRMQKGDKFLATYKDELSKADTSGFEYTGYTYAGKDSVKLDVTSATILTGKVKEILPGTDPSSVVAAAKKGDAKAKESLSNALKQKDSIKKESLNAVKSYIVGESATSENWKDIAMRKLRGSSDKQKLSINTSNIISVIEGKGSKLEQLKESESKATKAFTDSLKFVDDCSKALKDGMSGLTEQTQKDVFNKYIDALKVVAGIRTAALSDITTAAGLIVQVAKEEVSQARDIARKLISSSRKASSKKISEGTEIGGVDLSNGASILSQFGCN